MIKNANEFFDNNLRPKTIKKAFLDTIGAYSIMYRDFAILKRPDDIKLPGAFYRHRNFTFLAPAVFAPERSEATLDALKDLKEGLGE